MDSINVNERLIEILKSRNLIPSGILDNILSNLKGKDFQEVLLEEGLISKEKLTDLLSEILGWKVLTGKEFKPDEEAVKSIPPFLTKFHNFVPLKIEEKTMKVGFFPPVKPTAIEDIRLLTGYDVEPYLLKITLEENENLTSLDLLSTNSNMETKTESKNSEGEGLVKGIEIGNWDESELNKIIEELTPEGGIFEEGSSSSLVNNEEVMETKQEEPIPTIEVKEESISEVLSQIEGVEILEEGKIEETEEKGLRVERVEEKETKKEEISKKTEKDLADKIIESIRSSLSSTEKKGMDDKKLMKSPIRRVGRRKLLGEVLLEKNLITKEQLDEALALSSKKGIRLGEALLELKLLDDVQLAKILSEQFDIPFKSLREVRIDHDLARLLSPQKARENLILPLYRENGRIIVGIVDPSNIFALDDLRMVTKSEVFPVIVPRNELVEAINQIWGSEEVEKVLEEIIVQKEEEENQYQEVSLEEISSQEGPIAKLVNSILVDAVRRGASDIHIEPTEKNVRVRFRIDGVLHEIMFIQKRYQAAIVSRIKIMSDMDISERRIPQDGRIKANIRGEVYDFRVSTLPGVFGEKVVLRILGRGSISLTLESLGFSEHNYERYLKMLKTPYGIILVTGPTGSGKSTTLYASLNMINSPDINIITVEDPVEYQLPGIHQVQVNPKAGLTFASALRSILRQDPDVVLVGEIRDEETARIAIQAALTGHLVLSTLHTNDAPSAVTRLIDMGIEPFLISSSLLGAVAQRLVRTICPNCKAPYEPTKEEIEAIKATLGDVDLSNITFYKGKGCPKCNGKGYKGRTAIHEIMLMNDEIRELVLKKASRETIKEVARKYGMVTLREDGMQKVLKGITTVEEVMRVTAAD
jgi:type IV pilus assembly protein PilB